MAPTAPGPHDDRVEDSVRVRLARTLCRLAIFLMPACIIATSWGLTPFAGLMVLAMLLAPELLWTSWRRSRRWTWPLLLVALPVGAVVLVSKLDAGVPWSEADNRMRVLLMPLFALAVVALRPERLWLWSGALVGLVGACMVVLHESFGGVFRPGGWTNPIVFADVALGLMVVATFCRPARMAGWILFAQMAGLTAILLTGSRGVWPGLAVIAAVVLLSGNWRGRLAPRTWILLACLLPAMAWIATPLVFSRVDALQRDAARYDTGDVDSSLGARLDLLAAAGDAFRVHPWHGVGVGNFGGYLETDPDCLEHRKAFCRLGHAHSDIPEWAATMGIPGLLAMLLLYGVPLVLFARQLRGSAWGSASAADAGLLFVVTFALSGLTQSMFAHQLTASFYAVMVGLLAGFCISEREIEPG